MPINRITATANHRETVGSLAQFTAELKVTYEALERPCKIGGVTGQLDFTFHSVGWSINNLEYQQSRFHIEKEDCVSSEGHKNIMDEVHFIGEAIVEQKVGVPYWTPFTGGGVAGVTIATKRVIIKLMISADGATKKDVQVISY